MHEIKEKSLSWVLSLIPLERESQLYIIDTATGNIQTSTFQPYIDSNAKILDIDYTAYHDNEITFSPYY